MVKLTRKQKLALLILRRRQAKKRKSPEFWVRKIFQERSTKGEFHLLVKDMELFDHELFFSQFRMTPQKLEELLSWVGPLLVKKTETREPIEPRERLCVTLRFLVTGDPFFRQFQKVTE